MLNTLPKKFVLIAAAILLSTTIDVDSALAAIQSFDFKVTANGGPFDSQTFLGDFTFDDRLLTRVGSETLNGSDEIKANFNFGPGFDFNEFDNNGGPKGEFNSLRLDFFNGKLIGFQYVVDSDFGMPPNNPLPEGILGFDIFVNPSDGERDFTYFDQDFNFFAGGTIDFEQPTPVDKPPHPTEVPEASTFLGIAAVGVLGRKIGFSKKSKSNK